VLDGIKSPVPNECLTPPKSTYSLFVNVKSVATNTESNVIVLPLNAAHLIVA